MVMCPLCGGVAALHAQLGARAYHRCGTCRLVFLDRSLLPDAADERARYETHENDPSDPRYRAFLDRLAGPLIQCLTPGAEGLDYGSGPGPTLSVMLEERGFPMAVYDPFFAPDASVLDRMYDFVTCTETAEHFFEPGREIDRMASLLRPGGWIGIMTGIFHEEMDFEDWWYVRDPTHVCFYAPATFRWIADHYGWRLLAPGRNVVIFEVPGGP